MSGCPRTGYFGQNIGVADGDALMLTKADLSKFLFYLVPPLLPLFDGMIMQEMTD